VIPRVVVAVVVVCLPLAVVVHPFKRHRSVQLGQRSANI
jgi:hypothetical protein